MIKENIFLIQMGHNGRPMAIKAIDEKYCDGVVLSPSDFRFNKNKEISEEVKSKEGIVLFDPHWYLPRSERPKLADYGYFSHGGSAYDTSEANEGENLKEFCRKIIQCQEELNVDTFITPSKFLDVISEKKVEEYYLLNKTFIDLVKEKETQKPILVSLPISSKTLVDVEQRENLLNKITMLDVEGIYLSIEVDKDDSYPMTKPTEVISIISFLSTIKNNGYYVLLGHTHHVASLFMTMGIDGFASGHWKNLRRFDMTRWETSEENSGRMPALNYYSTKLINDLRVDQDLDALHMAGFDLSKIRSNSPFEENLFSTIPSLSGWSLRSSWDHYIWCCYQIIKMYEGKTLAQRVELFDGFITSAKILYDTLQKEVGILSQPSEKVYTTWKSAVTIIKNKYLSEED